MNVNGVASSSVVAHSKASLVKALLALALIASPSARAQPDDEEISPASDAQARTCTVLYDLDVTFQITDMPFGAGDGTHRDLDGQLVLQFRADHEGAITVGPVEMLHFWMHQRFQMTGIVTLTTDVHAFSPSCNGQRDPSWRLPSDAGFPASCRYTGNTRAIASGTHDPGKNEIRWSRCDAADTYWSEDRHGDASYRQSHVSSGKGCLSALRWVGNMHCSGLCGLGSPDRGDNPVFDNWTQPLINGPEATGINAMMVSDDGRASTIRTPTSAKSGYQSYNVPNDDRSRTWMSWIGKRRDPDPHKTCK